MNIKKISSVFLLSLLIYTLKLNAKAVSNEPIRIRATYGDNITEFNIIKINQKNNIEYSNNLGAKKTKEITNKDYLYLKNRILKLSKTSNDKSFCQRNHIVANFEQREVVGCIGSTTKVARELQKITNLVSILF